MIVHGRDDRARQPNLPQGPLETPENKKELHMTFLPKSFGKPELMGLLAAVPAAFAGSVLFIYMLDIASRLTA